MGVSKIKMEKCFINAKKSSIGKNYQIPGGASINNCVFMGEVRTYSEGFNITNSEILGGLVHGGKNSRIEKILLNQKKNLKRPLSLSDNITVINNQIENSVGLGFSASYICTVLNNKISGKIKGVRLVDLLICRELLVSE